MIPFISIVPWNMGRGVKYSRAGPPAAALQNELMALKCNNRLDKIGRIHARRESIEGGRYQ